MIFLLGMLAGAAYAAHRQDEKRIDARVKARITANQVTGHKRGQKKKEDKHMSQIFGAHNQVISSGIESPEVSALRAAITSGSPLAPLAEGHVGPLTEEEVLGILLLDDATSEAPAGNRRRSSSSTRDYRGWNVPNYRMGRHVARLLREEDTLSQVQRSWARKALAEFGRQLAYLRAGETPPSYDVNGPEEGRKRKGRPSAFR